MMASSFDTICPKNNSSFSTIINPIVALRRFKWKGDVQNTNVILWNNLKGKWLTLKIHVFETKVKHGGQHSMGQFDC
jgi:hypothetical protein